MHGITSYGTYVPHYALDKRAIAEVLGSGGGRGVRSVASFDEDSTSMGVEAGRRALAIHGEAALPTTLHFATTAPAYADKTNATAIHAALRLDRTGFAVDMAGAVRGAAGALRAAAATSGIAVLSDVRMGRPGSADERDGGDGAAAFVFGDGPDVVAEIIGTAAVTGEFLDRWRLPTDTSSRVWEERFGAQAYAPLIADGAAAALADAGLEAADHVVVSSAHTRAAADARKRLAGDQAAAELGGLIGFAGAADVGLALADVLDRAQPGETVLVVLAADGCDAWVLRVTDAIAARRAVPAVRAQLDGRRPVSYGDVLTWRGVLEREPPRRPDPDRPASPASARTAPWKFGFVASLCGGCSAVNLPPQRICVVCGAVDDMTQTSLADTTGRVATYTIDRLAFSLAPPVVDVVVDFEGGGRYQCEMADVDAGAVAVGDEVEMTFRRLYTVDGVHNYFWKAKPRRQG
jgi:hydroxymethylglutaryl-CoA synthase